MNKRRKNFWIFLTVFVAAFGVGGVLVYLMMSGPGVIRFVWFVDGPTPLVAVVEQHDWAGDSDDYQTLRVVELETKVVRGRLQVGVDLGGHKPRLFGPFGNRAWLFTRADGLRQLDLERATVALDRDSVLQRIGGQVGGDLRVNDTGTVFDFPSSQLRIEGRNGTSWLLAPDLALRPFADQQLRSAHDDCAPALRKLQERTKLFQPDMRACFGNGAARRGFVQHAAAAFGDTTWRATLFDAEGAQLWTKDASELVGDQRAWFGGAYPRGNTLLVLVAAGTQLWAIDVHPTSGAVERTHSVI